MHSPTCDRVGRRTSASALLVLTLGFGMALPAAAQLSGPFLLSPIVVTGDPAPDGDGTFNMPGFPSISSVGDVSFQSSLSGTLRFVGAFVYTGTIETVARTQDPLPDGNGTVFGVESLLPLPINDDAEIAFQVDATGATPNDDRVLVVGAPGMPLRIVVREGRAAPDGNGEFLAFQSVGIQDNGEVVFYGHFRNTSMVLTDTTGIYRGFGSETATLGFLEEIARTGSAFGVPSTFFTNIETVIGTETPGRIAFRGFLQDAAMTTRLSLFRELGAGTTEIVTVGDPSPDGVDAIFDVGVPFIGRDGTVAAGLVFDGGQSTNMGVGAFRPTLTSDVLVREGDPAPSGSTFTTTLDSELSYASQSGEPDRLAFRAFPALGASPGLFLYRGGPVLEVALRGDPAPQPGSPTPDGEFSDFFDPYVLPSGRMLFYGTVMNQAALGDGIFAWEPGSSVVPVLRVGESLLGSTVSTIQWQDDDTWRLGGIAPMNTLGDVVLRVRLADGRHAILSTSLPEPSAPLGLGAGLLLLAACERRRHSRRRRSTPETP